MAYTRRDKGHLGIDTNVLIAYLDGDHPSHDETRWLAKQMVALNPTIIHEAYHTLVFKMKWRKEEAFRALTEASTDQNNLFVNQTLQTTRIGLQLAVEYELGGRDALILASCLIARISEFITYDEVLLRLKKIKYGRATLTIRHP